MGKPDRNPEDPLKLRLQTAGLHEGRDIRVEQVDGLWVTEVRMRDVAFALDPKRSTGLYEYHPLGAWTQVGRFGTLRQAEVVGEWLRAGTHMVRGAHSTSVGDQVVKVPVAVLSYEKAHAFMVEVGLVEDHPPPETEGPKPA